ncbi:hypothetical protein D3C87_2129440 [compost metagenome]
MGLRAQHHQLVCLIGLHIQPMGGGAGNEDADVGHAFDHRTHDVARQLLLHLHPRLRIAFQKAGQRDRQELDQR